MKRGVRYGLIAVLVGALVVAFAGLAGAKIRTKTFSSGTINEEFGEADPATHEFDLNKKRFKRSKIKDVNVAVRISSGCGLDLDLELTSPNGRTVLLADGPRGGTCSEYGSGPESCDGTLTVFNDEAETPIGESEGPFDGQFVPEERLSGFDRSKVNGTWHFETSDQVFADPNALHCVELEVKYKKKKRK